MIKVYDFRRIDIEVKNAVQQAFDYAKTKEKDKNDYYLFLCNATYRKEYEGTALNPYVIDDRVDTLIDTHRLNFLNNYLNSYYSFSGFNTFDSETTLTLEMMLYTHIWESKTFLKQLKKLLDLCLGLEYEWDSTANLSSRQWFIRKELRDKFKSLYLDIATIMTNGYRSQYRNAFAHSDYSFALNEDKIHLHNYQGKNYQVKSVLYDEWTKFFCHSFLLNFYFIKLFHQEKQKMNPNTQVHLRNKDGEKKKGLIIYDKERNDFTGKLIER
jgi:hypothetical protein